MTMLTTRSLLRRDDQRGHVGPIELLFDLVYVFTIIQLSHYIVAHLDGRGFAEAVVLFLAVWWGWNYTAWAMNWLSPHSRIVQLLLAVLMLAALAMAVAIPDAFHGRGGLFVSGYLTLQLLRSAVMVWAFRGQVMGRNYAHLLAWSATAGVIWLAGLLVDSNERLVVWALAVVADYAAPRVGFWVPGRGTAPMHTWPVDEAHLAERNRLVFIIALGESILVLGGVLSVGTYTAAMVVSAVTGFATMFLLWWLYFDLRHGNAEHELDDSRDPTAASRGAYAYAHGLMVGGAILVAVGIEEVVHHPGGDTSGMVAIAICAGPVVYLLGNLLFQRSLWGHVAVSRLMTSGVVVIVGLTAMFLPPLGVSFAVVAVLVGLAIFDARPSSTSNP